MSKLTRDERISVLKQLLEGSSVSSTVRLTDVSMPTILKLLVDVGEVCAEAHDRLVRKVKSRRVQADEIWSFVGMKQKNTDEIDRACGKGDAWTWLGIDADNKLIVSYLVADRLPIGGKRAQKPLSAIWPLVWPSACNSPRMALRSIWTR